MELIDKAEVLKILNDLWDLAEEVEADMGESPTAKEALEGAMDQVTGLATVPAGQNPPGTA